MKEDRRPGLTRALKEKDPSSSATLTEEPRQRTNAQVTKHNVNEPLKEAMKVIVGYR